MSLLQKILLGIVIAGGLNYGLFGVWGLDFIGWLCGGTFGWAAHAADLVIGVAALGLLPTLFSASAPEDAPEPGAP